MNRDTTVIIPTIRPRVQLAYRAIRSVLNQSAPAQVITVVNDDEGRGAAWTRTKGLMSVGTEWTAFLDDDDEFCPNHLERLLDTAERSGADLVFPWFTVIGGSDPFPQHFGRQWDRSEPRQTTITFLVRTELAQAVGGFIDPSDFVDPDGQEVDALGNRAGEDFRFVIRFHDAVCPRGAGCANPDGDSCTVLRHLPERLWRWHHHGGNLSGRSWRQKVEPAPDSLREFLEGWADSDGSLESA